MVKLWFHLETDEVLRTLGSSRSGLSVAEVERRLKLHGPNLYAEDESLCYNAENRHADTAC